MRASITQLAARATPDTTRGKHDPAGPYDAARERRHHHRRHRHRHGVEAGAESRQVAHLLKVEGVHEEEPAHGGESRHRGHRSRAERDRAEEADIDQRLATVRLVGQQADQRDQGHDENSQDPRRTPPPAWSFDDAVGQAGEHGNDEYLAHRVGPATVRRLGLGDVPEGKNDGDDTHWHIDPENGAPTRRTDKGPADHRPERDGDADHRAPHADGLGAPRGSVKVLVMMDIATGFSMDPPTAWSMRKTTRKARLGAKLQSKDAVANNVSPIMKVRRRPSRSAVEPESMSRLANTRV